MIKRTYHCLDCGDVFEVDCESNDPDPPCPYCAKVLEWRPGMFAIGTAKGKAVDVAQQVLEEDYGLTNFNDSSREGDIAAKMPVETTADREAMGKMQAEIAELEMTIAQTKPVNSPGMQHAIDGFWGGPSAGSANQNVSQTLLASAKAGKAADGQKYVDPIAALHTGAKKGLIPTNFKFIGRA